MQISEPNTSEPLHSSCTRTAKGLLGSATLSRSPMMYTVTPPIGGKNTSKSGRVISSGNIPPVCSNKARRNAPSVIWNRLAIPGKYQTGSIAALVTTKSPPGFIILPSICKRPFVTDSCSSGMLM